MENELCETGRCPIRDNAQFEHNGGLRYLPLVPDPEAALKATEAAAVAATEEEAAASVVGVREENSEEVFAAAELPGRPVPGPSGDMVYAALAQAREDADARGV
jgi:hypothetical protein